MNEDCGDWDLESQYEDRNGDPDFNTWHSQFPAGPLYDDGEEDTNGCDCPPCIAGDQDNCVYLTDEDVW